MDKVIKHGLIFNAGFDGKSKDDMKRAVQDIIASASNINFDTPENRKQLKSFISVFRDMFESVGNTKIDFAAMFKMPGPEMFDAFKNSAEEVADVWAQVVNRMGTTSLRNVFMKDAQSLNDAFERLKKNGKVVTNRIEKLGRAFGDIRYTDINKLLNEAIGEETRFTNAENWEERTAAALRYIKIRDKILSIKDSDYFDPQDIKVEWASFFKDITSAEHTLGSYFVRDLKEVVPEMQTSLNNIFNLYHGKEIELVPKVIQPLNVRDLVKGKQDKVEIPAELKLKLDAYRQAFQSSDTKLRDQLEKEITNLFPQESKDDVVDRLWSFGRLPNLSDRNYNAIWKDFIGYGMPVGDGGGIGTGGVGDRTSEDVENARKVAEYEAKAREEAEAKERADQRRRELTEQLEMYADDGTYFSIEELENQKVALQDILIALKQEKLLTDELQTRYDIINSEIDERISLLQSVQKAYTTLDEIEKIDYNQYDADEAQQALNRRREILSTIPQSVLDYDEDISVGVEQIEQENAALENRIALLQQVKQGLLDIEDVDDILKERGSLDDKLDRLQDVSDAWGTNIKDSEVDEDSDAIEALEQFEATYDRIVLKLANGRKIEILPNAKGLRALHKYYDGIDSSAYGETEIEDIEFVRKAIQRTTDDINVQNNALQENLNLKDKSDSTQTDGTTPGEAENLEKIRAKVAEVTSAVESKTKAFNEEASTVNTVVDSEIQQLTKLEEKINSVSATLRGLLDNIKFGDKDLSAGLSNIVVNVNHQNSENQVDDNSENTFNAAIQSILDNIQKNTANFKSLKLNKNIENVLTAIKTAIESVDKKIVRGTRTIIGGEDIKPKKKTTNTTLASQDIDKQLEAEKNKLTKKYHDLGVLEANFAVNKTKESEVLIGQLQQEIETKQQSLQISEEELNILQQIRGIAKEDTINVLNARQSDKDAKKQFANDKKMAQREAMLGKTSNAVSRAENTWISALGLDGKIPASFEADLNKYYNKLDALRKKHQELKNSDVISDEQKQDIIAQTMSINKLTDEMSDLVSEYQRLSGSNVDESKTQATTLTKSSSISDYESQLKQYVQTITNGKGQIKGFNAETKSLTYTVKTGKNEFTEYTAAVRHLGQQLVSVQGTTKRTETFLEATKRKMKEITSYISGMTIIRRFTQEIRRGIQYIREIDLALTELKKVTDATEETYDKFLKTAAKTGERIGSTISAVTEATATFAKLGYSMEQAAEMAEAALVYKNVGDNIASAEDAANSIISTLKGFGMEASQAMFIVDKFNEVGNRFAITSQGIGEALRLSASALNEGKNSLDESIALITAANEVVNDPSSVGTALKTLTLRLRGSKTELEAMGEDVSDMATTTSQLQAKLLALTGGKVDIMLDENTFKNSTQILREMAEAWKDMTDIQRANALELMGGKRQANVLSALIQNFDTVEKVIETAANSAGSALAENERYLDSIQGKIDQFTNATQAMWSNALDSDAVKRIVELGTQLIKIVDDVGLLKIALMGVGMYLTRGMDFTGFSKPAVQSLDQMRTKLAELKADMDNAVANDTNKKTKRSHRKAEEATQRYKAYETKTK